MSMTVIVGAGPIGLYLAFKLYKAGVSVIIYDPRAGIYTRPGHVNNCEMQKIKDELQQTTPVARRTHIKDIERILYERLKSLNIPIENKTFVRFNYHAQKKGIIVVDSLGVEELVECDFVFDCTGSRQVLINELNSSRVLAPFTFKPISNDVRIKNYFLAFVRMEKSEFEQIEQLESKTINFKPTEEYPYVYAQSLEQLRALGWKEFGFPRYYGIDFDDNKACLYFECPDNLPEELHNKWVQSTLNAVNKGNFVFYSQLPPSKKYDRKPRFEAFEVDPQIVEQVSFEHDQLPTIILAGDAQIHPHHELAHGIKNGMRRVDILMQHLTSFDGDLIDVDTDKYSISIQKSLKQHKKSIIAFYKRRATYFTNWLIQAESHYYRAIQHAIDIQDRPQFIMQLRDTLDEIKARISLYKARQLLSSLYNFQGIVLFETTTIHTINSQLEEINTHLKRVLINFSDSLQNERAMALEYLQNIACIWRSLGTYCVKNRLIIEAFNMYNQALKIYQHPLLKNRCQLEIFSLRANILLCKYTLEPNDATNTMKKEPIIEEIKQSIKSTTTLLQLSLFKVQQVAKSQHNACSSTLTLSKTY